eukprot:714200-Prorocentrum_lima.AAC.1
MNDPGEPFAMWASQASHALLPLGQPSKNTIRYQQGTGETCRWRHRSNLQRVQNTTDPGKQ